MSSKSKGRLNKSLEYYIKNKLPFYIFKDNDKIKKYNELLIPELSKYTQLEIKQTKSTSTFLKQKRMPSQLSLNDPELNIDENSYDFSYKNKIDDDEDIEKRFNVVGLVKLNVYLIFSYRKQHFFFYGLESRKIKNSK